MLCRQPHLAVQADVKEPHLHLLQVLLQFSGLLMLCTDLHNLHSSTVSAHDCKCAGSGFLVRHHCPVEAMHLQ